MAYFPATKTAYNLVSEYCSIQRVIQYQQSYDAKAAGITPVFDTRGHEKLVYHVNGEVSNEAKYVCENETTYEKEELTNLLLTISNDKRLTHFKVSAIIMIEDFNKINTGLYIGKSNAYDDFMKDGFVLTDHLLSNTKYALNKYFHQEVKSIQTRKTKKQVVAMPALPKIKMKINVEQFAYLIRLMQESDLFETSQKTDVAKLIIAHFSTKGADEIGETSMINKLSETEKAEAIYWVKMLKEWRNKALSV